MLALGEDANPTQKYLNKDLDLGRLHKRYPEMKLFCWSTNHCSNKTK